jgi:hypothetical protein
LSLTDLAKLKLSHFRDRDRHHRQLTPEIRLAGPAAGSR